MRRMIAAACHIHSEWSYDGKWSLPELVQEFRARGYGVLMVTEHDRGFTEQRRLDHRAACANASTEQFLVLPGIEYSDAENRVHILVWGEVPFVGENVPTSELLKAVQLANGVAVLAHPARRDSWKVFDPTWTAQLLGIEVWNRKTDGWAPSPVALRLATESCAVPFVGMDFHTRKQMFPLTMRLDVAAPVGEQSVLECLRMRRCSALAMGKPISEVSQGWSKLLLDSAERCRRNAATVIRALARH
jgi:predicted metal-dependent phosphoesterase TrpH